MQRPLLLNSNVLLENTATNRLLVWDWLGLAMAKPEAFCNSHVQDQAAFTILVLNRSLPLVNPCPYMHVPSKRGYEPQKCVTAMKHPAAFLSTLRDGAFEVVPATEYDLLRRGYLDRSVSSTLPVTTSLHWAKKAVRSQATL